VAKLRFLISPTTASCTERQEATARAAQSWELGRFVLAAADNGSLLARLRLSFEQYAHAGAVVRTPVLRRCFCAPSNRQYIGCMHLSQSRPKA